MTKDFLLKASIREFQDNCKMFAFTRALTPEGYAYLIIDETTPQTIFSALHIDTNLADADTSGIVTRLRNVELSTREALKDLNVCFKAHDMVFFVKSFSGYNETMKQYMYLCDALSADKLDFLSEPTEQLGASSYGLISAFDSNILPIYFREIDFEGGRVFLEIDSTEQITLTRARDNHLRALCKDSITLHFINKNRFEVMNYLKNLGDYTLSAKTFGFASTPKLSEKTRDIDKASQIKGASYEARLDISYTLESSEYDFGEKYIRKVYFTSEIL